VTKSVALEDDAFIKPKKHRRGWGELISQLRMLNIPVEIEII